MLGEIIAGAAGVVVGSALGSTHTTETKLVPYCREVKEYRAPTDESIKLVREYEQRARDHVLDAFVLQSNVVSGYVVRMREEWVRRDAFYVVFELNGHTYKDKVSLDDDLLGHWNADNARALLLRKVAQAITTNLTLKVGAA